jgi:acyl-CoA synthetase (AMP-forming)/AMP-acid ligase II
LCNAKEGERLADPVRVMVGASPPTPYLFEQMVDLNLHPTHVYGMTETYGPITKAYYSPVWNAILPKEKYRRMARQGHAILASLAVRVIKHGMSAEEVVDVSRNGEEVGEVVVVGNICANGYYKDAEATRKLFAGDVLHSGDLAVWHPDGAIQILDRSKDIIISGKSLLFT